MSELFTSLKISRKLASDLLSILNQGNPEMFSKNKSHVFRTFSRFAKRIKFSSLHLVFVLAFIDQLHVAVKFINELSMQVRV